MLPAAHRLRRSADIAATIRGGRRAGSGCLVVHLRRDPGRAAGELPSRAGFVVSAKVGNSVVRHRVTRRLRPLLRDRMTTLPAGTDVVVRALPSAASASGAALATDLTTALHDALARSGARRNAAAGASW